MLKVKRWYKIHWKIFLKANITLLISNKISIKATFIMNYGITHPLSE